jgi:hypothetical protein
MRTEQARQDFEVAPFRSATARVTLPKSSHRRSPPPRRAAGILGHSAVRESRAL